MPLLLGVPWLLGAFGVGAVSGAVVTDGVSNTVKWAALAGAAYLIYVKVK